MESKAVNRTTLRQIVSNIQSSGIRNGALRLISNVIPGHDPERNGAQRPIRNVIPGHDPERNGAQRPIRNYEYDQRESYPSNVNVNTQTFERKLCMGLLKRVSSSINKFGMPIPVLSSMPNLK